MDTTTLDRTMVNINSLTGSMRNINAISSLENMTDILGAIEQITGETMEDMIDNQIAEEAEEQGIINAESPDGTTTVIGNNITPDDGRITDGDIIRDDGILRNIGITPAEAVNAFSDGYDALDSLSPEPEPEPEPEAFDPDIFNEDGDICLRTLLYKANNGSTISNVPPDRIHELHDNVDVTDILKGFNRQLSRTLNSVIYNVETDAPTTATIFTIPLVDVSYESKLVGAVFDQYFNKHINIINAAIITQSSSNITEFALQNTTFEYLDLKFKNNSIHYVIGNVKFMLLNKVLNNGNNMSSSTGVSLLNSLYMHKMKDYVPDDLNSVTDEFTSNAFTQSAVYMNSFGEFKSESGVYCMTTAMFDVLYRDVRESINNLFIKSKNMSEFMINYTELFNDLLVYEVDVESETMYLIKGEIDDSV